MCPGIFPDQADGGIMPNPADPGNPAQAFPPAYAPIGTVARFFGSGCDVRLRPHVLNSLISEILSTVDGVGLNYNPSSLINLRTAVSYCLQQRAASFAILTAQGTPTNYYGGSLTPPLLGGYNNGQVLCVVPTEANQSWVRVDLGGGAWIPVLRNDHAELEADDWPAWVPQLIQYFNGAFFQVGLSKSQVPIVLNGAIYFWIRPDGSDQNDGTANEPSKAFRTIDGAWAAVGSRFAASPSSHIGFILGVPGDYEGCAVGPYGSAVSITGDLNNPSAYRIRSKNYGAATYCVGANGINAFYLNGVHLMMDLPILTAYGNRGLLSSRCSTIVNNVSIELAVNHPFQCFMMSAEFGTTFSDYAGVIGQPSATFRFIGNGNSCDQVLRYIYNSISSDHNPDFYTPPVWSFENINIRDAGCLLQQFSSVANGCRQWVQTGCTGRRHAVGGTSNLDLNGRVPPGNQPGVVGSFSVVNP